MKKKLENPLYNGDWRDNSRSQPRRRFSMRKISNRFLVAIASLTIAASTLFAQEPAPPAAPAPAATPQAPPITYKPNFPGDPARSDAEAAALAYMRVVIRAQRQFNKQYDHFATSLAELVHSGSFTKRMVNPNRGDYTVGFEGQKDSYILTPTPSTVPSTPKTTAKSTPTKKNPPTTSPPSSSKFLVLSS